jgi:alginate O-acetyltransferase complex protein AlgI
MSGYAPTGLAPVLAVAGLALAAVALGLAATRRAGGGTPRRRSTALVAVALVAAAERASAAEPGGFRMVAVCLVLLLAMKAVAGVESIARGGTVLPAGRWLAFTLAWPGMDPAPFARPRSRTDEGRAARLVARGAGRLAAGSALLAAARMAASRGVALPIVTALVVIGASLVLHFGVFTILAGLWRRAGVPAEPSFRAPFSSARLAEFWGRRWNAAFTELVKVVVYAPLRSVAGRGPARFAGFLFSGLLHELAITVPAGAGYGGPLLYFALQGLLVAGERRIVGAAPASGSAGWRDRVWTLGCLVVPLPLLVPLAFVRQALWPLAGVIR